MMWLAMTGRMATSVAAAKTHHDFAGAWLDAMLAVAHKNVDERDPSSVRGLLTAKTFDALRREAYRHGFVPWVISGCAPTGEGFTRWRRAFITRYDRRGG